MAEALRPLEGAARAVVAGVDAVEAAIEARRDLQALLHLLAWTMRDQFLAM